MRYILIAILAIVSILAGKIYFNPPEIYNAEKLFEEKNLKFAFVGDIMLDRDVEKKILKEEKFNSLH